MRGGLAHNAIGSQHGAPQPGQAVPSCNGPEQQTARLQDQVQRGGRKRQMVRRVEQPDAQAEVEASWFEWQRFQVRALPIGTRRE